MCRCCSKEIWKRGEPPPPAFAPVVVEGEDSYTQADNSVVVATDSMKNITYCRWTGVDLQHEKVIDVGNRSGQDFSAHPKRREIRFAPRDTPRLQVRPHPQGVRDNRTAPMGENHRGRETTRSLFPQGRRREEGRQDPSRRQPGKGQTGRKGFSRHQRPFRSHPSLCLYTVIMGIHTQQQSSNRQGLPLRISSGTSTQPWQRSTIGSLARRSTFCTASPHSKSPRPRTKRHSSLTRNRSRAQVASRRGKA